MTNFIRLCNPCASEYQAIENFRSLDTSNQIYIGALTSLVAILTLPLFGFLAILTFRCLVKKNLLPLI